jgi:hypothetical protein
LCAAIAERMLLEADKSAELANVFRIVADAEMEGVAKFSDALCRDLVRTVVCRVYAPPLLELCHLIRAADSCAGGYEAFFWGSGPARAAAFRSYAERNLLATPGVEAVKTGLKLGYGDGEFTVTFSRMPFLSALLEFLVTSIGYRAVDDAVASIRARNATAKQVSAAAKDLASQVYAYLKDHMSSAQSQRKFRRLIAFLDGAADASPEAVDDEIVLEFWLRESDGDEGADFKTYRAVYLAFLRFIQALAAAREHDNLENVRVLGADRAAGEVDPHELETGLEVLEDSDNPLGMLAAPPCDAVRFLTKTEARALELLVESSDFADRLPLSLLRCEVFGAAQARITQGLRRRLAPAEFVALIDDSIGQDYQSCRDRFAALTDHVERLLLASFHALAEAGRAEAITVLLRLRPELDYSPLAAHFAAAESCGGNVVPLAQHGVAARFATLFAATDSLTEPLQSFVAEAKAAFGGFTRTGFRDRDLGDGPAAEGFAGGEDPLFKLRARLAGFGQSLARAKDGDAAWRNQFEADRTVFLRQFHSLYGADI